MRTYILLDRSGSMQERWIETISALNGYVKDLAENKDTKKMKVTVCTFDKMGGLSFNVLRDSVKATEWDDIQTHEDSPRGLTPLFDAINTLYAKIVEKDTKKASVIIMTDGGENGSRDTTKDQAKKMLDVLRDERGYDVVFLGADFDAFAEAGGLGNAYGSTLNTVSGSYVGAMKGMAAKTQFYASSGTTRAFTEQERSIASSNS